MILEISRNRSQKPLVFNCSRLCQVLAGKKASLEGNNGSEGNNDGITRLVAFNFRAVRVGEQDYQFVGL